MYIMMIMRSGCCGSMYDIKPVHFPNTIIKNLTKIYKKCGNVESSSPQKMRCVFESVPQALIQLAVLLKIDGFQKDEIITISMIYLFTMPSVLLPLIY